MFVSLCFRYFWTVSYLYSIPLSSGFIPILGAFFEQTSVGNHPSHASVWKTSETTFGTMVFSWVSRSPKSDLAVSCITLGKGNHFKIFSYLQNNRPVLYKMKKNLIVAYNLKPDIKNRPAIILALLENETLTAIWTLTFRIVMGLIHDSMKTEKLKIEISDMNSTVNFAYFSFEDQTFLLFTWTEWNSI